MVTLSCCGVVSNGMKNMCTAHILHGYVAVTTKVKYVYST